MRTLRLDRWAVLWFLLSSFVFVYTIAYQNKVIQEQRQVIRQCGGLK